MTPELAPWLLVFAACSELVAALIGLTAGLLLLGKVRRLERANVETNRKFAIVEQRLRKIEASADYRQVRQVVEEFRATSVGWRQIAKDLEEEFAAYRREREGNGSNPMGKSA